MAGFEYQTSIFDGPERPKLTEVEEAICCGSGFSDSRIRIYAAAVNQDLKGLARFLKDEYGIGGFSIANGLVDFNGKGLQIRSWKNGIGGYRTSKALTWSEVAEIVRRCISVGAYLRFAETDKVNAIRSKNNGKLPMPYPRFGFK